MAGAEPAVREEFRQTINRELETPLSLAEREGQKREEWGLTPEAVAEAERADAMWGDYTHEGGVA